MPAVRIIGPGRAGRALAAAIESAGWLVLDVLGRTDLLAGAADGADLVIIATPDDAVADVAGSLRPDSSCVMAHVSGSLPLSVLDPHERRASLHPLRSIPSPSTSLAGAWFAVAGDPLARQFVEAVGGRPIEVLESKRAGYHAAAAIAANHLAALAGQVERVAADAGVPLEAYLDLMRGVLDNIEIVGPRGALTGPVARGDWSTVAAHVAAIKPVERPAYLAMAAEAARLAGHELPAMAEVVT